MRKLFLGLLILAFAVNLNAQEQGKIRVGLDGGLSFPNAGFGFTGDLDIRYNIMDNLNLGVKFGLAALAKDMELNGTSSTVTACAITSSLLTGDYYFNKPNSSFVPFLGGGFGSYSIGNFRYTATTNTTVNTPTNIIVEKKLGGLLRTGFEAGHFRMALEYYIIPGSSFVNENNEIKGITGNSYVNLAIGFYLGGGKWRKNTQTPGLR